MKRRVQFYVQHLLGIGHVVRAMRIARALAAGPFEVELMLGGPMIEGLAPGAARLVPLPAVGAASGTFSRLVDAQGAPLTEAAMDARRDLLLGHFDRFDPDILLIEAFPFGRRQMRFELVPLLQHARARERRVLIASSVRDILQQETRPGRAEEYAALVERYFDLVLVHGDPALADFSASFPLAPRIAERLRYTGIVGPGSLEPAVETHDVIVSAGGGAVGGALIRAALAARPLTRLADARWLVVTGPNLAEALPPQPSNVILARFLPDLPQRLAAARLSISQAGYNTVADLLAARCRAVLAPYGAGGETEQTQRATLLEARGLAIFARDASPPGLARALEAALELHEPPARPALDGARRTSEILASA